MGRTSCSPKWMAMPSRVPSRISLCPEVSTASISASSASTDSAMMPPARGLPKAASSVFFTIPLLVASSTYPPAAKSRTAQKAAIFSPVCTRTRLTTALPLPCGPTSGISWTLSQCTRPRSVKIRM